MNRIEDDLKAALRRKPAPPGFADKILDRVNAGVSGERAGRRLWPGRFWMAAAAIAIGCFGIFSYQQHIQVRNEEALQRTLLGLSVAAEQLSRAEKIAFEPKRWEQISRHLNDLPMQDGKGRP
jgi:hypothetical protein